MQWDDEGIILSTRAHGEGHAVAELMTRDHGRHLGLVRGGMGRRGRPQLQVGSSVKVSWRARLENHLGNYTLDITRARAGNWMHDAKALQGMTTLASHLHLLAEREPHPELYGVVTILIDALDQPHMAAALLIRFELAMLQALGFGLDLSACAATGLSNDLTHVSPKSGRAVGRISATPYANRLLKLPLFLHRQSQRDLTPQDIFDGARLTGYFFDQHIYGPRGLEAPQARESFFRQVTAA